MASNKTEGPDAVLAACEYFGECGKKAAEKTRAACGGTMTFRQKLIDELSF